MDKTILLAKLPPVEGVDQDFYGIGYYSDSGFIFALLTEDIINNFPLRKIDFESSYKESSLKIIGKIENLRDPD